jgi:hypothetical protein
MVPAGDLASAKPAPHDAVQTVFLAPEAVLFDGRHGGIHHLNRSASAVWSLLDGEQTIVDVAAALGDIFSVPESEILPDVETIVADFRHRRLLAGVDRSEPEAPADREAPLRIDASVRPADPLGVGAERPVWAGRINMQTGRELLSVQYDDEAVATAIRERCAWWLSTDEREVVATFGVRTVEVGVRRRTAAVLYHGVPIRSRHDSLDEALDILASHLAEIDQVQHLLDTRTGDVTVDARAFIRNGRLVLAHVPAILDVDQHRLHRRGIEELHTWRPLVECAAGTVTIRSENWPLHGVVIAGHRNAGLDDARRRAWALGSPSEVSWAELIDALDNRVHASAGDLYDLLDRALS